MTSWRRVGPRGLFAAAMLSFLFPFLTVSCQGQPLATVKGSTLVTGGSADLSVDPGMFGDDTSTGEDTELPPHPIVVLAAMLAVGGLSVAFSSAKWAQYTAAAAAALGVSSLLAFRATMSASADVRELQSSGFQLSYGTGWWAALLSFGAAGLIGGYNLRRARSADGLLDGGLGASGRMSVRREPSSSLHHQHTAGFGDGADEVALSKTCVQCGKRADGEADVCSSCQRRGTGAGSPIE